MPTRSAPVLLLALGLFVLPGQGISQPDPADLILLNGKVFTSHAARPHAEAVAIRGERIVAVGTTKEILRLAAKHTKRIDVGGRRVIPGINDAHDHIAVEPESYWLPQDTDLPDPTWSQAREAVAVAVAKTPPTTHIQGLFGPKILENSLATRTELDELAPAHAVFLWDFTGHAALLNTAALRRLGIQEDRADPLGGTFVRSSETGRLTGWSFEYATFLLARRFSELAEEEDAVQQMREYLRRAARLGITSVQNMSMPLAPKRCVALLQKAPTPIRVRVIRFLYTDQTGRLTREEQDLPREPSRLITVSGTKWVLDGTPIERSAALREPYADRTGTSGALNFSESDIVAMLREALENDDQLLLHVAGDRTAETLLRAMETTGGEQVWSRRRVRFEHGDGLTPDLAPKAKKLGIIVVQNPTHMVGDLHLLRYGRRRADRMQPLRSLLTRGIPVAIGSDGPNNPYLNIMLASTPAAGSAEALTREQAVTAYTLTSAGAEFAEKDKGSLEPGKLADLAVLNQDIFRVHPSALPKTESVLTLVGGRVVHDAKVVSIE